MTARRRATVALVVLAGWSAGTGYAVARLALGVSARVRPATIYYREPKPNATNINGRLPSGRSGVRVVLELRRWPFQGSFKPVARERSGARGSFNFVERLSRATQFRVSSSGAISPTRTVYVYPGYANAVCTWSSSRGQGPCSHPPARAGDYTIHFSFDYLYPATVYRRESRLKVFVYFAECFGCSAAPRTLQRQRTVSQTGGGSTRAHVSISQGFSVRAGQRYRWYLAPCVQSTERGNGFGLPGNPGSHHCGSASVSSRYFHHGRDLG